MKCYQEILCKLELILEDLKHSTNSVGILTSRSSGNDRGIYNSIIPHIFTVIFGAVFVIFLQGVVARDISE